MSTQTYSTSQTQYDQDYALWLKTTIEQLRNEKYDAVDWGNLLEELEDMGRSEKRSLVSLLTRLIEHLLKLAYWDSERERCEKGWKKEITTFRTQIQDLLKDSPSLKPYLHSIEDKCFNDARESISIEIGFDLPSTKIATSEQTLDKSWFPDPHRL